MPEVKYDKNKLKKFIEDLKNKTKVPPKKYAFKKLSIISEASTSIILNVLQKSRFVQKKLYSKLQSVKGWSSTALNI